MKGSCGQRHNKRFVFEYAERPLICIVLAIEKFGQILGETSNILKYNIMSNLTSRLLIFCNYYLASYTKQINLALLKQVQCRQ
jgi:hypothetical protein